MEGVYLTNFKVNGVKSLDKDVELSFYKKVAKRPISFHDYNIKGIYGINGSGKTAIVSSVKVLKDILYNPNYLNNQITEGKLLGLINKKNNSLQIEIEYLIDLEDIPSPLLYKYNVELCVIEYNSINIVREKLECKNASSYNSKFKTIFEVESGEILFLSTNDSELELLIKKETVNLLSKSTLASLFSRRIFYKKLDSAEMFKKNDSVYNGIVSLLLLGISIFVYLDENDTHDEYVINEYLVDSPINQYFNSYIKKTFGFSYENDFALTYGRSVVHKNQFQLFSKNVDQLKNFLQIFKRDLINITIDKNDNKDFYLCRLILNYKDYTVDSEFESTGVKKIIKLFMYIKKMCEGNIVFIDEFDSNLHDVYLCALIEFLSDYSKGQLCFTSHNIGPMSILNKKKKSIDFLSVDKTIYSWTNNGNYSPSTLYHNGMIEGSPFNIESIDFIGVFD